MTGEEEPDWEQLMQGFALTGHFIERQFFTDRRADALAARAMLIDRVRRMVGLSLAPSKTMLRNCAR
jgi:DNA repair protein RecO (recombination protein O)